VVGRSKRVVEGRAEAPPNDVYDLFHDLRQPVAAIGALVAAAETIEGIPDEVNRRLEQIREESRRISALIRQAQAESMEPEPLDAGALTIRLGESFEASTGSTIQIVADADATVVADGTALTRALGNLIDNAMRAAGPAGNVLVTVQARGAWVQFDVHDSGPGFGEGPKGTLGLGLKVVEWFAAMHEGTMTVDRSHLGGTLVRLRLPAPDRSRSRIERARS
jgi:signal transduction histidine kinase